MPALQERLTLVDWFARELGYAFCKKTQTPLLRKNGSDFGGDEVQ